MLHAVASAVDGGGSDLPLSGLQQFGLAGTVLAIFFAFGWYVYKNERADRKEAQAEVARLNKAIQEDFVPAQLQATTALVETNKLLARLGDAPRRRSS